MRRRSFLKAIGLAAVAAALPPIPVAASYPHFRPEGAYGNYVTSPEHDIPPEHIREHFEKDIAEMIPPEYRDEIEWIYQRGTPGAQDPLEQHFYYGWKYPGRSA